MRLITTLGVLLFSAGTAVDAQQSNGAGKQPPTEDAIMEMCGGRLVKVLKRFGMPEDVFAYRGDAPEKDSVYLDYGTFSFKVRDKTVLSCVFWSGWKGTIKGIKMGDSRDKVVEALGDNYRTDELRDGVVGYGWEMNDDDSVFWVVFDRDQKVQRVQVVLK